MSNEKVKKTLYIERKAADFLSEMSNASDYVSGLVVRHEREWAVAWRNLRESGWTRAEVDLAVRIMRERWLVNDLWWDMQGSVADALGAGVAEAAQAGIDPDRWSVLVAQTQLTEARGHQRANDLLVISREQVLGNDRARTRLAESVRVCWVRDGVGQGVVLTIDPDVPDREAVKDRLKTITNGAHFIRSHGFYEHPDHTLLGTLTLVKPDGDQARVAELICDALGIASVGWYK